MYIDSKIDFGYCENNTNEIFDKFHKNVTGNYSDLIKEHNILPSIYTGIFIKEKQSYSNNYICYKVDFMWYIKEKYNDKILLMIKLYQNNMLNISGDKKYITIIDSTLKYLSISILQLCKECWDSNNKQKKNTIYMKLPISYKLILYKIRALRHKTINSILYLLRDISTEHIKKLIIDLKNIEKESNKDTSTKIVSDFNNRNGYLKKCYCIMLELLDDDYIEPDTNS